MKSPDISEYAKNAFGPQPRRPGLLTQTQMRIALANAIREAGGQQQWATRHGLSKQYVNGVVRGRQRPGGRIAWALGYRPVLMYEVVG